MLLITGEFLALNETAYLPSGLQMFKPVDSLDAVIKVILGFDLERA